MSSLQLVWLSIAVSAASVIVLFLRCGARDILPYLAAYFAFFGLGPAINFARNERIYFRIDVDDIGRASLGLALALAAMAVTGLVLPIRHRAPAPGTTAAAPKVSPSKVTPPKVFPLVPAALFGLAGYALVIIALRGEQMLQLDKNARIDLVGGWHYRYLLLEFFACSLYFVARHRRADRIAYWTNLACYTAYCLVTRERDFIFVLFALLLYLLVLQRRGNIAVVAAAAGTFIVLATYLTSLRSGRAIDVTSALNEGSVLTVDTLVIGLVPATYPFLMGQTYGDAVLSLLPGFLVGERGSLAEWLIATVAPASRSGYGFSLTAEAYLNFGMPAIPVVFGALTAAQRYLLGRAGPGPFPTYLSLLFTLTWLYNFRGESRAFLVSMVWGVVFYGLVTRFGRTQSAPAAQPRPPSHLQRPDPQRSDPRRSPPRRPALPLRPPIRAADRPSIRAPIRAADRPPVRPANRAPIRPTDRPARPEQTPDVALPA